MRARRLYKTKDELTRMAAAGWKYAILMETSGQECESWMNFIRFEGNEEALRHLQSQLDKVDFVLIDDLSTFDLEIEHLVSEQTAKEMCGVDLNAYMFHRKFDGTLKMIDFQFSRRDTNDDRIEKINELIGLGDIDQYVEGEDPCEDGYELNSPDSHTDVDESTCLNESQGSQGSQGSQSDDEKQKKNDSNAKNRRRPHRK